MEFAAARNPEGLCRLGVFHAKRDVGLELAHEPVTDVSAGDKLALAACEGRGVDHEEHADGRLVDFHGGQPLGAVRCADGVAGQDGVQACDHDDVAGLGLAGLNPLEALEADNLRDAAEAVHIVLAEDGHARTDGDATVIDATDGQATDEGVIGERGDLHAEGGVDVGVGCRHRLDDALEDGAHVDGRLLRIVHRVALLGRGVDDREVELLIRSLEGNEEVETHVENLVEAGVRAVNLVDDHDGLEAQRQRLPEHEAGLGHGPLDGVNQQEDAVDHLEDALDFATEVGVSRCVDDVEGEDVAAVGLVVHRGALGQDGDAALTLLVVAVHGPLGHLLVGGDGARLTQQLVDQRRFAVVDVGDDCDVADELSLLHDGAL